MKWVRDVNWDKVFLNLYPMKAKGVEPNKIPWHDKNYIWEEKFDGDRRLLWITKNKNYNTSRNKSKETGLPTDKTENVPHITYHDLSFLDKTILDGEFIHTLGMDKGVRRIMGCLPDLAIERQKEIGNIEYIVYDILCYKGEWLVDKPLHERKDILKLVFQQIQLNNPTPYIQMVESFPGGDKDFLESKLEEILNKPFGEGMVAKHINSKYRVSTEKCQTCLKTDWVKVKKGFNGDFVIMGYEDAEKEYTGKTPLSEWPYWENGNPVTEYYAMGWIGSIIYGEYRNGILTPVGTVSSGLTKELRAEISANKDKYIGKVIEIDAFERVPDTLTLKQPRFKGFRDDKLPEECIYEHQKG